MESKHATTSVGMWGLFVIAAAQIANQLIGVTISDAETQVLINAYDQAIQAYTNAATVLGAIMAILGRRNAKQPVHFVTPFVVDDHGQEIQLPKLKPPTVVPPADVQAVMLQNGESPKPA